MKKCYCGQENEDAATKCIQCGGTEFMSQGRKPGRKEAVPPPIPIPEIQKPVTGTYAGKFHLREKADDPAAVFRTVASSLGGLRRGLLLVGNRQLILKQRLTAAGKFLLGVIFFLSIFLLLLSGDSASPIVENLKGIAAITLLAATLAVPTAYALWLRRFKRELNRTEMTGYRISDGELELYLTAGSPGRVLELAFTPEAAADLPALQRLLTEWGVAAQAGVPEEITAFQQNLTAATSKAWVTLSLILANVLIFLVMQASAPAGSPPNLVWLQWGADFGPLSVNDHQWWRLLASCFLHAGILHLAFNMFALFQAGSLTEKLFGNWFYLAIYLGSGLAGSLTSLWSNPETVSVGASGAIFGVYGALLAYFTRERAGLPRKVLVPVFSSAVVFVIWNLVNGLLSTVSQYTTSLTDPQHHTGPMIDMAAHCGGLVGGFILGFLAARPLAPERRRELASSRGLAMLCGVGVVLGLLAIPALKANQLDIGRMKILVDMYARGEGVPKNTAASIRWLQQAAATGDSESQAALGATYCMGAGLDQDFAQGTQWLSKAAEQGNPNAEKNLMVMAFNGQGGPTNNVEGVKWLGKLADQGADQDFAQVERNVGVGYYTGNGLPEDHQAAIKWLTRAANHGDSEAKDLLQRMGLR